MRTPLPFPPTLWFAPTVIALTAAVGALNVVALFVLRLRDALRRTKEARR